MSARIIVWKQPKHKLTHAAEVVVGNWGVTLHPLCGRVMGYARSGSPDRPWYRDYADVAESAEQCKHCAALYRRRVGMQP